MTGAKWLSGAEEGATDANRRQGTSIQIIRSLIERKTQPFEL